VQWSGWKAGCFVVALASGLIYSAVHTRDAAADEIVEPLRQKLLAEYVLPQATAATSALRTQGREAAAQVAAGIPGAGDIRFRSVTARGLFRTLWVRVEIEVNGHDPPDGRAVRYFRLHRSAALGQWLLDGETTALAYHLPF
jgi:hypothetical protein